jgi:hypothetical protein
VSLTQSTPPSEVIFAGPLTYQAAGAATVGWAQVAASSTAAQCLVTGATGASGGTDFTQPLLNPGGGLWHERLVLKILAAGVVSTVVTAATTATFSFGVTTAPQLALTTGPATGTPITLMTSQAYVNAGVAWSNIPWRFDIDLLVRQVGYGTAAVSTAILATGIGGVTPLVTPAVGAVPNFGPLPPSVTTTVDTSVNNWVWGAVTFGTNASTSNTCTMLDMIVLGLN